MRASLEYDKFGGYQPVQKWLKDRKNRKLEFDDILHYQKIITALIQMMSFPQFALPELHFCK